MVPTRPSYLHWAVSPPLEGKPVRRYPRGSKSFRRKASPPRHGTAGSATPRGIGRSASSGFSTPPRQRGPKDLRDRDAQERRRHVGTVVHVLLERARVAPPPPAHQPDRVDVEEECRGTLLGVRHRIEDVRLSIGEFEGLEPLGVLGEEEPEVGRGAVSGRDGEQHLVAAEPNSPFYRMASPGYQRRSRRDPTIVWQPRAGRRGALLSRRPSERADSHRQAKGPQVKAQEVKPTSH